MFDIDITTGLIKVLEEVLQPLLRTILAAMACSLRPALL
jgi:hypothetical protein